MTDRTLTSARTSPRARLARALLFSALASACVSLAAADRWVPAFSAAASAVRNVVDTAPRPADVAASAAQAAMQATPPASASPPPPPPSQGTATPPATAAVVVTCMRPSDVVTSNCQPGQQLSLTPIVLPTARFGMVYKPRRLVTGGVAPYRFEVVEGSKPDGLDFRSDGSLAGRPIGPVRPYTFTVLVTDASTPSWTVRQAYALRVDGTPSTRARATAAAPASAPTASPAPATQPAPSPPGPPQITSYMLLQEDLDDLFLKLPAADGPTAASETRRRVRPKLSSETAPYAEKMHTMLAPMLNIDYPTADLFGQALEARRCAYYTTLIAAASAVTAGDLNCPPGPKGTPAAAKAPSVPGPATLYADLLPAGVKRDLIAMAAWPHLLSDAKTPRWTDNGCGCAPPYSQEMTYGFYPFWQAGGDTAQQLQFNVFNRIGFLGAQLTDAGTVMTAGPVTSETSRFVRTARRFGTRVDIVIHRSDWSGLLNAKDTEVHIDRAVHDTIALADTPLTGTTTDLKRYLLPFWDEPRHLFDGITLFFDNPPSDAAGKERFRLFYRSFVHKLILEMQKTGRTYTLNIIAPDHMLGETGSAYGFEQLMDYIRLAQMPGNPRVPEGADPDDYIGTTDITVTVLAWLHEPTSGSKKELRARIDKTDVIQGHRRVAFLNAVMPVLFHSGGEPDAPRASVDPARLDLDLAYFKWQYGGVGFWPLPRADASTGQTVNETIQRNYGLKSSSAFKSVCEVVCPHRTPVRLLFMALLLTGLVSFALYVWVCAVRRLGRPFIVFLWLGGVATVLVGFSLLSCDPQLAKVRDGNGPLIALLAVAVAAGMYYSLKPRVAHP